MHAPAKWGEKTSSRCPSWCRIGNETPHRKWNIEKPTTTGYHAKESDELNISDGALPNSRKADRIKIRMTRISFSRQCLRPLAYLEGKAVDSLLRAFWSGSPSQKRSGVTIGIVAGCRWRRCAKKPITWRIRRPAEMERSKENKAKRMKGQETRGNCTR